MSNFNCWRQEFLNQIQIVQFLQLKSNARLKGQSHFQGNKRRSDSSDLTDQNGMDVWEL